MARLHILPAHMILLNKFLSEKCDLNAKRLGEGGTQTFDACNNSIVVMV